MEHQIDVVGQVDVKDAIKNLSCRVEDSCLAFGMQWVSQPSAMVPQWNGMIRKAFSNDLFLREKVGIDVTSHKATAV